MNYKMKMLQEGIGYRGNKFEKNYHYSNLIRKYARDTEEMGIFEAYVELFTSGENAEVIRHLSKNVNEVVYLSKSTSPILLEGYAKLDGIELTEDYQEELNEGILSWIPKVLGLGMITKVAKKYVAEHPKEAQALSSTEGFLTSVTNNKQLTPEQKKEIITVSKNGTANMISVQKLISKYIEQNKKIQAKQGKAPVQKSMKVESFVNDFNSLLIERISSRGVKDEVVSGQVNPLSVGAQKDAEFAKEVKPRGPVKEVEDTPYADVAKQGGNKADIEPSSLSAGGSPSAGNDVTSGELKYDSGTSPVIGKDAVSPGVHADPAAMAAAATLNSTVSSFLMGIPLIGPFIAPFSMVLVGLMTPLLIMAIRRIFKGKKQ